MKTKRSKIIFVGIIFLTMSACTFALWKLQNAAVPSLQQSSDVNPLNVFTDPVTGFTIKYPPLYFLKAQSVPTSEWNYRTLLTIDDNPDAPQTMSPHALPLEVDIQRQPVSFAKGKIFHSITELQQSGVLAKLMQGVTNPNGDLVTVNGTPALLFHAPRSDYTGDLTDSYYFIKNDLIYEVAVNVDDSYAQKMVESISWDTPLVDEKTALAQLQSDLQNIKPHFISNDDGSAQVKYTPEEQKIRDDLVTLFASRYAAVDPTSSKQSLLVEAGNGIWPHAIGKRYILLTEASKFAVDEILDIQTGQVAPFTNSQGQTKRYYVVSKRNIALYINPQVLYTYSLDQVTTTLITGSQLSGTQTYHNGYIDGATTLFINPEETHTTNKIIVSVFDSSKRVPNPDVSGATMYAKVGQKTLSF